VVEVAARIQAIRAEAGTMGWMPASARVQTRAAAFDRDESHSIAELTHLPSITDGQILSGTPAHGIGVPGTVKVVIIIAYM
jgi:hypothetical protein